MAAFVTAERAVRERGGAPLVNLHALAPRPVCCGLLAVATATGTYYGLLFTLALYLQQGLGRSARLGTDARLVGRGLRRGRPGRPAPAGALRLARGAGGVPAAGGGLCRPQHEPVRGRAARGAARRAPGDRRPRARHPVQRAHRPSDGRGLRALRADVSGVTTTTMQIAGAVGVAAFGTAYLGLASDGAATHAFAVVTAAFAALALLAAALAAGATRAAAVR